MISKFEYPGYELQERDTQFKLMLAWAEYHANYREHAGMMTRIGGEVMAAIARADMQADQHTEVCRKLLDDHMPGMNDCLDDIEAAVQDMRGWYVHWTDTDPYTSVATDKPRQEGWIVQGAASRVAGDLASGSVVLLHISERPTSDMGRVVNMASMQQIKFTSL